MTKQPDSCRCRVVSEHLGWAGDAVGSPVIGHWHLVGGMSSTVVRCTVADQADHLVLRVLDDHHLVRREPDIIDRKAEALRILALNPSGFRTPTLVAAEYAATVGRLLMTWIPGRINLLWSDGPGVVDWVNACVGHPHAELGHCRWNLAVTSGIDGADRFLDHYLALTDGRGYGAYDPWWDIDSLLDKPPGPLGVSTWQSVGRSDLTTERVAAATNAFLRSVLNGQRHSSGTGSSSRSSRQRSRS